MNHLFFFFFFFFFFLNYGFVPSKIYTRLKETHTVQFVKLKPINKVYQIFIFERSHRKLCYHRQIRGSCTNATT